MVLTKRQFNERKGDILNNPYKFMVLDVEYMNYKEDKDRMRQAIEVLNICNVFTWVNKMIKDVEGSKTLNINILYDVIDAILKDEPFSDEKLIQYIDFIQQAEELTTVMLKFINIDEYGISSDVDLLLLGFTLEEQSKLSNDKNDALHEDFGRYFCDIRFKEISNEEYINKSRALFRA